MPSHVARQSFSGAVTIGAASDTPSGSLALDPNHTGTVPGMAVPTLTVLTTASPTTTPQPAATSSTPSTNSNASKISTGAIIGIIVGIFVVLAVILIVLMSVRNKKRIQASRACAKSMSRKSWSRLNDDRKSAPAELQMRATIHANTASIAESNTRTGDESFLSLNSTHALIMQNQAKQATATQGQASNLSVTQPAPPSRNPFLTQPQSQLAPPPARSADDSHIPNPFTSPPASPSHSPSPSHASTYSSHAHSLGPAALSSFASYTPKLEHTSMITASSVSDYPYEFPVPPEDPGVSRFSSAVDEKPVAAPAPARLIRKQSPSEKEARSRELQAMQDLISALDERAQQQKPPPSSFSLKVDTSRGTSRLSMGEGLVTPGGHSIREEDAVLAQDENGNPYWTNGNSSSIDHESFPLPPAEVFRAALNAGETTPTGKVDKGKTTNPFRD